METQHLAVMMAFGQHPDLSTRLAANEDEPERQAAPASPSNSLIVHTTNSCSTLYDSTTYVSSKLLTAIHAMIIQLNNGQEDGSSNLDADNSIDVVAQLAL